MAPAPHPGGFHGCGFLDEYWIPMAWAVLPQATARALTWMSHLSCSVAVRRVTIRSTASVTSLSNASSSLAQSYGYDACGLMQLPQIGQPHRQLAPAGLQFQSVR